MKQGVVRAVFVGAMVVGLCGVGAASPLSVDSHTDHSFLGYYGYHYSIDVFPQDDPVAEFIVFAAPLYAEDEDSFKGSFLQGWLAGDPGTVPLFGFYALRLGEQELEPLPEWSYELVFDGPLTDPVYPQVNDYVRWSGPGVSGTANLYFGFCNTSPWGDVGWRIDERVPPNREEGETIIWEPIHGPVPEPSGLVALASGLVGLGGVFFRRRRR